MIFVTVGAQMPFDRLVLTVDTWAASHGRDDVFAQIGVGSTPPGHIAFQEMLTPEEFRAKVSAARVIVAHAGMGSILTAMQYGKPLLVLPRRADLRETRNDHQVATARQFGASHGIGVAMDEAELRARLDELDTLTALPAIAPTASPRLIGTIRAVVFGTRPSEQQISTPATPSVLSRSVP